LRLLLRRLLLQRLLLWQRLLRRGKDASAGRGLTCAGVGALGTGDALDLSPRQVLTLLHFPIDPG
jgi:hypothetical protein